MKNEMTGLPYIALFLPFLLFFSSTNCPQLAFLLIFLLVNSMLLIFLDDNYTIYGNKLQDPL